MHLVGLFGNQETYFPLNTHPAAGWGVGGAESVYSPFLHLRLYSHPPPTLGQPVHFGAGLGTPVLHRHLGFWSV